MNQRTLLDTAAICRRLGITPSTWRAYVARGQAPAPDERFGATPVWYAATIEAYERKRRRR
jgi:hypothetical protein